jgi:hypothetical protein
MSDIKPGDIITVEGIFEKRTFWQQITKNPRKLKEFVPKEKEPTELDSECVSCGEGKRDKGKERN